MLVYELPKFKSQIWSPSKNVSSQIISSNQTSYKLLVRNVKRGDILVFSEKYDPNWSLRYDNKILSSVKYEGMVNSFIFPEKGDRSVRIEYVTQRFVIMGIVASNVTVFLSLLYLILQPPFFRTNVSLSPGVKKRKSNTA